MREAAAVTTPMCWSFNKWTIREVHSPGHDDDDDYQEDNDDDYQEDDDNDEDDADGGDDGHVLVVQQVNNTKRSIT